MSGKPFCFVQYLARDDGVPSEEGARPSVPSQVSQGVRVYHVPLAKVVHPTARLRSSIWCGLRWFKHTVRQNSLGEMFVGAVAAIEEDGHFRITAAPGEYAVCYWLQRIGGGVSGCADLELPREGELAAYYGEAGFHITVKE